MPIDVTEVTMFQCPVCGGLSANTELVSEVFVIGGRRVLVERIPAQECIRCGEATFSRETTEQVRTTVNGAARPDKTVPLDVFALA
jgi:HTH-type transcriptional regulator/antitoxin MqsA